MRVRQKAQFELARRADVQPFLAAARDASAGLGRLHAIWGIAQLARRQPTHASHLADFLADPDAEVRAQAAKMIGDVRYAAAGDRLVPLLKDSAPRVQFFAAEALGRIAHKPATAPLVSMLAANDDRDVYLRHAGSLALASIGDASALEALAQHESRAVRLAAVIALRRMANAGVARFLADKDELVVVEAARAINDDGGIEGGLGPLAATLARGAIQERAPASPRHQREPPARDERSRRTRGSVRRRRGAAGGASGRGRVGARRVGRSLAARSRRRVSPGQRHAAAARRVRRTRRGTADDRCRCPKARAPPRCGRRSRRRPDSSRSRKPSPTLNAQLKGDPSVEVRLASLRALQALKVKDIEEVMKTALADKDPAVRKAALGILPGLAMSSAAKVQQLTSLIKGGSQAERQGALEVLGPSRTAESRDALGQYLDELQAGRMAPELQVDLGRCGRRPMPRRR